jgi:hypothetical protein
LSGTGRARLREHGLRRSNQECQDYVLTIMMSYLFSLVIDHWRRPTLVVRVFRQQW